METKTQLTNEKSVQLPSNTNLAGGYILITTVLCMAISEIQNAGMRTQLSSKFIRLGNPVGNIDVDSCTNPSKYNISCRCIVWGPVRIVFLPFDA